MHCGGAGASSKLKSHIELGPCMRELRETLSAEEGFINERWQQWAKIQRKIICLGVEVLGPGDVRLAKDHAHASSKKRVQQAAREFDKEMASEDKMQESVLRERASILSLGKNAVSEFMAQEKVTLSHLCLLLS